MGPVRIVAVGGVRSVIGVGMGVGGGIVADGGQTQLVLLGVRLVVVVLAGGRTAGRAEEGEYVARVMYAVVMNAPMRPITKKIAAVALGVVDDLGSRRSR
ncbi:MAG: hypothetical protein R2713_21120 [Ilumatobacteraceae bacterium]